MRISDELYTLDSACIALWTLRSRVWGEASNPLAMRSIRPDLGHR